MDGDQRDAVLRTVVALPGASTRELAARLGVTEWTVDYHLRRLKRSGVVVGGRCGRLRAWYAKSCGFCPVLRGAMPALRRPEAMALALAADETPATLGQLASRAGVAVGTARWVAGGLSAAFVLERSRSGRITLREGAATCIAQAATGQPCSLWGKCLVSRAWQDAERSDATAGRPMRAQAKGELP